MVPVGSGFLGVWLNCGIQNAGFGGDFAEKAAAAVSPPHNPRSVARAPAQEPRDAGPGSRVTPPRRRAFTTQAHGPAAGAWGFGVGARGGGVGEAAIPSSGLLGPRRKARWRPKLRQGHGNRGVPVPPAHRMPRHFRSATGPRALMAASAIQTIDCAVQGDGESMPPATRHPPRDEGCARATRLWLIP